jgi:hypothetical protein
MPPELHDGGRLLGRIAAVVTAGPDRGAGRIQCGGQLVAFEAREWGDATPPRPDDVVTFTWRAGRATRVQREPAAPPSPPMPEPAP